jgi:hypothetical protein
MRQVATSPRYFHDVPNLGSLPTVADRLLQVLVSMRGLPIRHLTVTDQLPPVMRYVGASSYPPHAAPASPTDWLAWFDTAVPVGGMAYSLKVRPQQIGHHPANLQATGELVDLVGRTKRFTFTVPYVMVLDPSAPPTRTVTLPPPPTRTPGSPPTVPPLPPTRTPPPVPTDTPVGPPPTRTPVPTPTGGPSAGYDVCAATQYRVPRQMIMDAMANPGRIGGYGELCAPSQPPSPWNGLRTKLAVENPSKPFHPLYNTTVWKCGCP